MSAALTRAVGSVNLLHSTLADAEKAIGKKGHYKTVKETDIKQNTLTNNSLVMVGMEGWADLVDQKHQGLTQLPSVLVMMGNAD